MSKIKYNPEIHDELFKRHLKNALDFVNNPQPIDKSKLTEAIATYYKCIGKEPPKHVIVADSPLHANKIVHMLNNQDQYEEELEKLL